MKLNLVPLVALLLCNCCLCYCTLEIRSRTDVAENVGTLTSNAQDKTHFTDLVDDVIFLIFDELDLLSLLRMGQTSKQISTLVTEQITRHFSLKDVSLSGGYIGKPEQQSIWMGDKIHIRHYYIGLNILKHFGSKIKGLMILTNDFTLEQLEMIVKYINNYCGNTLNALELFGMRTIISQLTKFRALEDFKFILHFKQSLGTNALNVIFPNLRRLSVNVQRDVYITFLNCSFPHLEHFDIEIPFDQNPMLPLTNAIERFLTMNPQIRSVGLENVPLSFFGTVNKVLPQLEHLSIRAIFPSNQPRPEIRFEHVRTFNFNDKLLDESITSSFSFPNLNECRVTYIDNDDWIEFFADHTNLTKLHMNVIKNAFNDDSNEFDFQQLMPLVNLMEFSLILSESVIPAEEIFKFIDNHVKLTKCQFAMKFYDDAYENLIWQRLEKNWKIHDFGIVQDYSNDRNLKGFSLEKKKGILLA